MAQGHSFQIHTSRTPENSGHSNRGISWFARNESHSDALSLNALTFGSYDSKRTGRCFVRLIPEGREPDFEWEESLQEHLWVYLGQAETPGEQISTVLTFQQPVVLAPGRCCAFILHSEHDGVGYTEPNPQHVTEHGLTLIPWKFSTHHNVWQEWLPKSHTDPGIHLFAGSISFHIDEGLAMTKAAS